MEKDPFSERLKQLEDRLTSARSAREAPAPRGAREFTQGSLAWRMVTELVVGMLLGVGIGLGLDGLFGTRPVFLVVFALLGFAGGVRAMMRTATEVGRSGANGTGRDGARTDRAGPGEE